MTTHAGAPVVVGVDGSARALDAVKVAAEQAALHHRPLRVVLAMDWPALPMIDPPGLTGAVPVPFQVQAESSLRDAVQLAEKTAPKVDVTSELRAGASVPVLLEESRHSYRIVVGDRGLGGFAALVVGSVAVQVAAHAACPVVVVRGEHGRSGPVVVGVDGSATSLHAVNFAAEEAALRGADLVAVHTWLSPPVIGPVGMMPMAYDPPLMAPEENRLLAESMAGIAEQYPDVKVRRESVPGAAAEVLRDWSRTAQLMVVGSRGRGGFTGLLLGSVSQQLIHHAACPVAVVRAPGR